MWTKLQKNIEVINSKNLDPTGSTLNFEFPISMLKLYSLALPRYMGPRTPLANFWWTETLSGFFFSRPHFHGPKNSPTPSRLGQTNKMILTRRRVTCHCSTQNIAKPTHGHDINEQSLHTSRPQSIHFNTTQCVCNANNRCISWTSHRGHANGRNRLRCRCMQLFRLPKL